MVYQTVQPVDRLSRVAAAARYAENRKGYDGRGKKNKERPPNRDQREDAGGDRFYYSTDEQPEEFGVLLRKLVEENRQMKETAKAICPTDRGTNIVTGMWMYGVTVPVFTKK